MTQSHRNAAPGRRLLVTGVALSRETRPLSLRVCDGVVVEIGPGLSPGVDEHCIDAGGGRLSPTLADNHLHIGAWLRAKRSLPFPDGGLDEWCCRRIAERGPGSSGWTVLFGLDHHHDPKEQLDRLDRNVEHAVLVVHRTGHAAFANQAGRERLASLRYELSRIGSVWREALGLDEHAEAFWLRSLRSTLLSQGVADVHDATPYPAAMADRVAWISRVLWPVRTHFMGLPADPLKQATHLKFLDPFDAALRDRNGLRNRPLAIHAVEPDEIDAACCVLDGQGRIEHAALCPEALVEKIARIGCSVCANPGFFVDRPHAIAPLIERGEAQLYQPLSGFIKAGIRLIFGSDAPVGDPGPWSAITGAQQRGRCGLNFPGAGLSFDDALRCATLAPGLVDSEALAWIGRPADFAILPRAGEACASTVTLTVIGGDVAFEASDLRTAKS